MLLTPNLVKPSNTHSSQPVMVVKLVRMRLLQACYKAAVVTPENDAMVVAMPEQQIDEEQSGTHAPKPSSIVCTY